MQDKHFKNERAATFWANRCVFFHKMFLQNNAGRKKAPRKGGKARLYLPPAGADALGGPEPYRIGSTRIRADTPPIP